MSFFANVASDNLFLKRALRYLILLSVVPLLVGHALSQCGSLSECPVDQSFALTTGAASQTPPAYVGTLRLIANGEEKPMPPSTTGSQLQFRVFDDEPHVLRISIDGGSQVGALASTWLISYRRNAGIKLTESIYNDQGGVFFDVNFLIDEHEYALPQQSMIASSSQYTISGGSTGSELIKLGLIADVYLNDALLMTTRASGSDLHAPFMFSANSGDVLRFVSTPTSATESTSEFWLHKPSGQGVKLLHRAAIAATTPLDVRYRIE